MLLVIEHMLAARKITENGKDRGTTSQDRKYSFIRFEQSSESLVGILESYNAHPQPRPSVLFHGSQVYFR